ncbi:hypothetical protein AWC38_SpisGene12914 [Stylophora pistillata]|uniref:Uncharacterized protein n=1 Tax=Stylophora pistillata TaxID=50429 RepID=A0A2B4S0K2_STYPI|nr:hypothetical protein AWC38_SpisGene12914 [Stylophora pistillata]
MLARTGVIDIKRKVKLSATRHDSEACPPGVWSCQTGKRSRDTFDAALFPVKMALKMNIGSMNFSFKSKRDIKNCPPGVWACEKNVMLHVDTDGKNSQQSILRVAKRDANHACPPGVWSCSAEKHSKNGIVARSVPRTNNYFAALFPVKGTSNINVTSKESSFKSKRDVENCPTGMWACKKKMTLKQMRSTAVKKSQQSKGRVAKRDIRHACPPGFWSMAMLALAGLIDIKRKVKLSATRHDSEACPPGVWSCQTEKRSEVGDGWRDISGAAVLFFNKRALKMNIESMDSSFKNKRDVENCPPGMWARKTKMMLKQMVLTAIGKSQPSTGRVAKRERERERLQLSTRCLPCSNDKRIKTIDEANELRFASSYENEGCCDYYYKVISPDVGFRGL